MNNKVAKKIRKAARELPESVIEVRDTRSIKKSELPPIEQEKVADIPGQYVSRKGVFLDPINHEKLLKQYYQQYGAENDEYMRRYVQWFQDHHMAMLTKYPHLAQPLREEQKELTTDGHDS